MDLPHDIHPILENTETTSSAGDTIHLDFWNIPPETRRRCSPAQNPRARIPLDSVHRPPQSHPLLVYTTSVYLEVPVAHVDAP